MRGIDEMIAVEEHWPVAMQDRDRAWLLAHTTEDLVCIQPDGLLERMGYVDHRVEDNDTIIDGRNTVVRAEVAGDVGYTVNRAHFLAEDAGGRRREIRVLGSTVYRWEDDTWKVAIMHITQVPNDATNWAPLIELPL
jgi:ketosteroid isomerase-like protein